MSISDITLDTILFVEVARRELDWRDSIHIEVKELSKARGDRVFDWIRSDVADGFLVAFGDCQKSGLRVCHFIPFKIGKMMEYDWQL